MVEGSGVIHTISGGGWCGDDHLSACMSCSSSRCKLSAP